MFYTTTRNASREKLFKWVGPILPRTIWIYGKKGLEKKIHTLKDLHQVKFGIVREEASIDELLAAGVPKSAIQGLNSNADVMKMLQLGRIDTMVNTEIGMQWNLRNASVASNELVKLMTLSEDGAYYFAFNLKTDPAVIEKLQRSLDRLKREGKLEEIIRKYMRKN
jgi:polar amino acid transport system substrate-binding protein